MEVKCDEAAPRDYFDDMTIDTAYVIHKLDMDSNLFGTKCRFTTKTSEHEFEIISAGITIWVSGQDIHFCDIKGTVENRTASRRLYSLMKITTHLTSASSFTHQVVSVRRKTDSVNTVHR